MIMRKGKLMLQHFKAGERYAIRCATSLKIRINGGKKRKNEIQSRKNLQTNKMTE